MKKIIWILILIGIIFAGWFWLNTRPVDASSKQNILVKIESGDSLSSITATLAEKDLIRSETAFKWYARAAGTSGKIKAGAFLLNPSQSASEILEVLTTGKSQQISVTIPEGYSVSDIDALMASKGLGASGAILDCAFRCDFSTFDFLPLKAVGNRELGYGSRLEGYLFPETYYIDIADYQPKFFLERLLGTFRKRVITAYEADIKKSGRSLGDLVIMASIVEKESRVGTERPIVAGILWKRLDTGIALGVDATLRYALGKPTGAITQTDLGSTTVYNTRTNRDLPPSPIANVGESAIRATLHPETSGYWYYLHDPSGLIHYAVTNDEHNQNRARYLR